MARTAVCRRTLAGTLAVLAVLWAGPVTGQEEKAPTPGKTTKAAGTRTDGGKETRSGPGKTPAGEKTPLQVKAFTLSHTNPEDMRQTLVTAWAALINGRGAGAAGAPAGATTGTARISAHPRTRTLFVRGTEKELAAVGDLIGVLDVAPGKPFPEDKGLRVVRLRHARVPEVVQVLTDLGLSDRVVPLARMNAVVLPRDEREAKEVQALIEKVDVEKNAEERPARKPPRRK